MGAETPPSVAFVVRGPIAQSDLPGLCERVRAVLSSTGAREAVCEVQDVECDAVTVDALARLQLVARRNGCRVHLRGACSDLVRLVEFMGLRDVLPDPTTHKERWRAPSE